MRMDCVILDGYTLNPGDPLMGPFGAAGPPYHLCPHAAGVGGDGIGGAEAAMTNKTPIGRAVFEACPGLRYVGVLATGYNVVDLEAARDHGVTLPISRLTAQRQWLSMFLPCCWS